MMRLVPSGCLPLFNKSHLIWEDLKIYFAISLAYNLRSVLNKDIRGYAGQSGVFLFLVKLQLWPVTSQEEPTLLSQLD